MKKETNAGMFNLEYNIELITTNRHTGEMIDYSEIKNDIVNVGLEQIARMFIGDNLTYFRGIAIGTGNTAVTSSDTTLETEVKRELATLSYVPNYKSYLTKIFTFTSGESYTIKEVGIFNNSTSGGVMFNRALDAGKVVDVDTDLTVNVTITASAV